MGSPGRREGGVGLRKSSSSSGTGFLRDRLLKEKFEEIEGRFGSLGSLPLPAAAAAKSLQSCPTLSHPMDCMQPTRLLHPWDSPGKNTGVGCHCLLRLASLKVKSLSRVQLLVTPWTAAHQAPPSMGFSRQEYWSGVPLPSPLPLPRRV